MSAHPRAETDRPLADIVHLSNLLTQPFYSPLQEGASNLLVKARRALAADDSDRAERYIRRAVALPYDENEEADTALFAARMAVYSTVTDVLDWADEHDTAWLDAAESALGASPTRGREFLQRTLREVLQDYHLPGAEARRLRAALARYPEPGPGPDDVRREDLLDDAERADLVRGALRAIVLFEGVEFRTFLDLGCSLS